jgi:allophanate hydrolase subunit 2
VPDPPDAPIRLLAGPDAAHFLPGALARLVASTYRILPSSNRVGTRLDGPAIPRSPVPDVSRPMVIGAIEVPGDGQPIVLGPEHPTTGGYPVVAVVARADLGRLFSIRLGGSVRFALA